MPAKKSNLDVKVPKNSPGAQIEVKDEKLFKLPLVAVFCGQAGKGKSTAAVNLIRMFREQSLCDRFIFVSPTSSSNKKMLLEMGLPLHDEDIIDPNDGNACEQVYSIIEQERDDYRQYKEEMKSYKEMQEKLKADLPTDSKQRNFINQIVTIRQGMAETAHPASKHRHKGKKPIIWTLFDDCQGSKIFRSNSGIGKMIIGHRHLGMFPEELDESPLGLSAIFCVQVRLCSSFALTAKPKQASVACAEFQRQSRRNSKASQSKLISGWCFPHKGQQRTRCHCRGERRRYRS